MPELALDPVASREVSLERFNRFRHCAACG
jgi:hypothetical protein